MGAEYITMTLPGDLKESQIEDRLDEQRGEDRIYNGHQDGYSGDWQTVTDIKFTRKTFENIDEAYDYCSANCEKREGIAVKFKSSSKKYQEDKKYIKAKSVVDEYRQRLLDERERLRVKNKQIFEDMKDAKSKTIGCGECDSSLNRKLLKSTNCPMCETTLMSATSRSQLDKINEKIAKIEREGREAVKKLEEVKQEVINQNAEWQWLVFGIAAS